MTDQSLPAAELLGAARSRSPRHGAASDGASRALIIGLDRTPASAKTALLALLGLEGGTLLVRLPNGRRLRFGDATGPSAELHVHDFRFARRVLTNGDIGFAEGWIAGEWTSPDLASLLTLLAANAEKYMRVFRGGVLGRVSNWLKHVTRANSRAGARRNILSHYDLGNSFFAAWLDPSMTYSAARFEGGLELEQAQHAKYRALANGVGLQPGDHVLEIGCGWGGFAEIAAREFGARVTGVTISDEQLTYARDRMTHAGLAGQTDIRRQDYRDVRGQFDKIVSIEMFEAVGEEYWPAYFQQVFGLLKPGGRAALQIITVKDELFESYRSRADFIQRYIFPGGMLPSVARLRQEAAQVGLEWRRVEAFGACYAETLADWARRFQSAWPSIERMGFDERFRRLWLFYLAYCEAGFRTGRTSVIQLELSKPI